MARPRTIATPPLHDTNDPDSIGDAVSNGCPRLDDDWILALAGLVPAGTPVSICP